MKYNENKIKEITNNVIDQLTELINNEIYYSFGHSIDFEQLESLHEIIYNEITKEL